MPRVLNGATNDPVSTFGEDKNNAVDTLLSESSLNWLKSFTNLVWFHFFLIVENHIKENPDEKRYGWLNLKLQSPHVIDRCSNKLRFSRICSYLLYQICYNN